MKCFQVIFRGSVNIQKTNELSKPFILALENPHLYETYQDFFMLNVGTNYIFARQVRETTDKKTPV